MKKLLAVMIAIVLFAAPASSALADASIAYASTPLNRSSNAKRQNVDLAVEALNGTYIAYGEEFSFNAAVGARTAENGYVIAMNGRGVRFRGGGVAQVATTLSLALRELGSDIRFTERRTYDDRFADDYVSNGRDAVIVDSEAGIDFRFYNHYDDMVVAAYVESNEVIVQLNVAGGSGASSSAATRMADDPALRNNVELAALSINDTTLCYYDEFSFNDIVGPRTEQYGYQPAVNGRGVRVVGGGVAQVASTVWLAVKHMDDIQIVEARTYGANFNQDYVQDKDDAIVTDFNANLDFRFRYVGDGEMTIYTYVDGDWVYCDIVVDGGAEDGW